jgi:hypothetical protein
VGAFDLFGAVAGGDVIPTLLGAPVGATTVILS